MARQACGGSSEAAKGTMLSAASAANRLSSRPVARTRMPFAASSRVVARPMPLLAPVTIAIRFDGGISCLPESKTRSAGESLAIASVEPAEIVGEGLVEPVDGRRPEFLREALPGEKRAILCFVDIDRCTVAGADAEAEPRKAFREAFAPVRQRPGA